MCSTAMGTSAACMYATIFFSYHEEMELQIKSNLSANPTTLRVRFYRRYIDDVLGVRRGDGANHDTFVLAMNQCGPEGKRLTWEATKPGCQVNFLDLTITIGDCWVCVSVRGVQTNDHRRRLMSVRSR